MRFSLRGKEIQVADWREEEHPRDNDGKFADKGGDKKSSAQRIKDVFERRKTLAKSEKKEYNNNGKERNSTEGYVLNDPESIEVVEHIERGNLYDLETLYNLPVFKRIEEKISEYDSKYGKTSKITDAERIKNRDKWVEDFLNGANGAETMPPNGAPLKRESKATIVVGLPAAGKSTTIANPLSEEQGLQGYIKWRNSGEMMHEYAQKTRLTHTYVTSNGKTFIETLLDETKGKGARWATEIQERYSADREAFVNESGEEGRKRAIKKWKDMGDILNGLTRGKEFVCAGHARGYWDKFGDARAAEAFAEIASAKATSPESYAILKEYIPNTVLTFEEIYGKLKSGEIKARGVE